MSAAFVASHLRYGEALLGTGKCDRLYTGKLKHNAAVVHSSIYFVDTCLSCCGPQAFSESHDTGASLLKEPAPVHVPSTTETAAYQPNGTAALNENLHRGANPGQAQPGKGVLHGSSVQQQETLFGDQQMMDSMMLDLPDPFDLSERPL